MSSPFEVATASWQPVSPALTRVRLLLALIFLVPLIIACAVVAWILTPWVWIAVVVLTVLLLVLLWVIPRQVRALRYAQAPTELYVRRGVLFTTLSIVPYGRMQYIDVESGPLARAYGISSVKLHTASASSDATISGLPTEKATELRDILTERGESQVAGL